MQLIPFLARPRSWRVLLLSISLAGATLVISGGIAQTAHAEGLGALTNRLVRVGALRTLPASAKFVSNVPARASIHLDVVMQPRDPAALAAAALAVTSPRLPSFRHFISPSMFAATFGPSETAIAKTRAGLYKIGFRHVSLSANHLSLSISSTAGAVNRALHLHLRDYRNTVGQVFQAPDAPPALPRVIAGGVVDILGLDTQPLVHPSALLVTPRARSLRTSAPLRARPLLSGSYTGAESPSCESQINATPAGLTPDQIANAYGLTPMYQAGDLGAGVTIGVIEFSSYIPTDIASYAACLGISPSITAVPVQGGPQGANPQSNVVAANMLESELDLEDLIGLVPNASILDYEGPSSNGTISNTAAYDAYTAAISADQAKVITTSFGVCEPSISLAAARAENALFEQAALQGQTIIAAAGDNGSEDCSSGRLSSYSARSNGLAVDDPASQPFVTGVGGTTLTLAPARSEVVWNTGQNTPYQASAGGGGVSSLWAMPAYQSATTAALGVTGAATAAGTCAVSGGCREVPDLALDAGDPLAIYCSVSAAGCGNARNDWTPLGGTSAAAPVFAAIVALADAWPACQQVLPANSPTLGFVNPLLYEIASGANYQNAFTDIISGNNDLLGNHGGDYAAGVGYDLASGLGSPIAANGGGEGLIAAMCAPTTLASMASNTGLSPPTLSSIAPKSGSTAGGRSIAIRGRHMVGASEVLFGSTPAASFRIVSDSRIVAVAPPGHGTVHLLIETRGGISVPIRAATFSYLDEPTIRRLAPPVGPSTGHNTVVIIGTNLSGVIRVTFGTRVAIAFKVRSDTRIVATVPAGHGRILVTVATRRRRSPRSPTSTYQYH